MIVLMVLVAAARVALEEELAPLRRRLEARRAAREARAALPRLLAKTGAVRPAR